MTIPEPGVGDREHELEGILLTTDGQGREAKRAALDELRRLAAAPATGRPKIVCLCGSTRFYEAFQRANYDETMAGRIVLSVGFYPHAKEHGEAIGLTNAGYPLSQKAALDELHKRKIDLADEVLVLNIGGYVGASTRGEIEYAAAQGKPVRYLEPLASGRAGEDGR